MSDNLEYIDNFFKSEPDAEQRELFERRANEDPDFADELAFYLSSIQALRTAGSSDRKEHFRTLYRAGKTSGSTRFHLWPYMSAAAAIVFILLGAYFFYPAREADQIAQSYINRNLSFLPVLMNGNEDSIQLGLRYYNEEKLSDASKIFERLLTAHPDEYKVREYAGIVSLRLGNYDNALKHFGQLAEARHLYANSGNFYTSLTLLKRNRPGDTTKAKDLLEKIVEGHAANEQAARELLKEL